MKIKHLVLITVVSALISFVGTYFFVQGGEAQLEDFERLSGNYKAVADMCIEYYNEEPDKEEYITVFLYDDYFEDYTNDKKVSLTEKQALLVSALKQEHDAMYLWVYEDSVVFWEDETKYHGLVYSEKPLEIIWDMKTDWYDSLNYSRINSSWYEIGV